MMSRNGKAEKNSSICWITSKVPFTGFYLNGINKNTFEPLRKVWRWPFFLVVGSFSILLLWNDAAFSQDSVITPKISVGAGHDDNLFFDSQNKVSSSVLTVSPGVEIDYRTLLSSLKLTADLDILSYLDESDQNRTNQYYRLSGDHRIQERWRTSGILNYYRDTTLNTYLQETGRVFERTERDYLEAGGGVSYDIGLLSRIRAGYRFQNVNYDSDRYSDWDSHSGDLYFEQRVKNEIDTISVGPSFYYRSNDFNDVDSFALDLGWNREWSSITRSRALIGARYADVKRNDGTKDDTWGARAALDITHRGLVSTILFRYFHDLRTTVEGDDVNVDNFYLNYRRSITERFRIGFDGRLVFSYKLLDKQTDVNDERFYWLEPNLSYQLTRHFDLSLRYRYQNNVESLDNGDITRERNLIWLQLEYALPMPM